MTTSFDPETLFYELLKAEREEDVESVLSTYGLLNEDEALWVPYGGIKNNIPTIGNQQAMAMPAFVEKVINSVDAMLMLECQRRAIPLEGGSDTPRTMPEAAEKFFDIPKGRLENTVAKTRTDLADNIHVVVTGSKRRPSYIVIDRGEGQCPGRFGDTLVSISKENKLGIPFVQGKYNCGGTGVLLFCGDKNYQLVVSKRHPDLEGDSSKGLWGFTLVRKLPPTHYRRSSMFVYLAPAGRVPSFKSSGVKVLPGQGKPKVPPTPYERELKWGTCVKLYDYKMPRKGVATLELRYQLEKHLYTLCLPVRVTETRKYEANYYSTTVSGTSINIADHESKGRLEKGFPDSGSISPEGIGELPLVVSVYRAKDEKGKIIDKRDIPSGGMYALNGQVHGIIEGDQLGRRIDRTYIDRHLVVAVDCTNMDPEIREKFFMTSRDRVRQGELNKAVEKELVAYLKEHPALKEINAQRRLDQVKETLTDEEATNILGDLVSRDPSLADLLAMGTRIKRPFGPDKKPVDYKGKRFPTFFRICNEPGGGLTKECPLSATCRVVFETDAENKYFSRGDAPGSIAFAPPAICRRWILSDGRLTARFSPPLNARVGDQFTVTVEVTDSSRVDPFECAFEVKVMPKQEKTSGPPPKPKGETTFNAPQVIEVYRERWGDHEFNEFSALDVRSNGSSGYDLFVNMDNQYLLSELKREAKSSEQLVLKYWFKYGLYLSAIGMMREDLRPSGNGNGSGERPKEQNGAKELDTDALKAIRRSCSGVARVIIPVIRGLSQGPAR